MHNNQGNHKNGNLPVKNPHDGEIPWNFSCPRAIHYNGQIPIFEVPYKYIKNFLQAS